MGSGRRWLKHEWRSHNPHVNAIIKKSGGEIPKVRIRVGLTIDEAKVIEIAMISAIGREVNGGPLVNLTDGGEGLSGFRWSNEQREKMRVRLENGGFFRGKSHTEKARKKIRDARLGVIASVEARENMSKSQKGRKHSDETRAKMSSSQSGEKHAMFGRKHSESSKLKISEGGKGRVVSDETKKENVKILGWDG